jgi:CRISPR system Cascade subunit CasA
VNDASSFNVMDRPWIPVTMLGDGSYRELSIMQVFEQAEDIRSVDGDNPIQRFAICRMLTAFLYGVFEGVNKELWWALFNLKDENKDEVQRQIRDYCLAYHDRFDLFDAEQPFYQVAGLHTAKNEMSGLERLVLDVPSGEPFFTTRMGEGLATMGAAEAARWLVTVQAFDVSGIKSGAVGDKRVKGGKGYPIGVAWAGNLGGFLVEGGNLWQTLVLNFVGSDVLGLDDAAVDWSDDIPIWERPQPSEEPTAGFDQQAQEAGNTSYFHGPATLLTWQSRRIRLFHDGETVTGVLICNGDRLKPQNAQAYEMMTGWRRSKPQEKALKLSVVYMPRKHDPTRAIWRGLPLLTTAQETDASSKEPADYRRPYLLRWLTTIGATHIPIRLHAFGIEYGNQDAVVEAAVDDALDLNLVVLTSRNPSMRETLEEAVNISDRGINALRDLAVDIARAEGSQPESARRQIGEAAYSSFDQLFRRWIGTIQDDTKLSDVRISWQKTAKELLLDLGQRFASQASDRALVGESVMVTNPKTREHQLVHFNVAYAEMRFRRNLKRIFTMTQKENGDE